MNKPLVLSAAMLAALAISSCGRKSQQEEIVVEKIIEKPQASVKNVTKSQQKGNLTWIEGKPYTYYINYSALDSVPAVENYGVLYHDNAINLTVKRSDGSDMCNKTITKNSFSGILSNDMRKHGVLLSLVYDKLDSNHLYFVATIGSPDDTNDDFVMLSYVVDRYGDVSVGTYTPPSNPGE